MVVVFIASQVPRPYIAVRWTMDRGSQRQEKKTNAPHGGEMHTWMKDKNKIKARRCSPEFIDYLFKEI